MQRKVTWGLVSLVAVTLVGFAAIPGCRLQLCKGEGCGGGPNVGGWGGGGIAGAGGESGEGAGGTSKTPEQEGEEAYAALDPEERSRAALRAGATTSYLAGTIESLDLDPSTVDQATLAALMQQYGPDAQLVVDQWLATLDPAALPLATSTPRYECTADFGCQYTAKCLNEPFASMKHMCFVNDCGDAKCTSCPDWFPDVFKKLFLSAWCSYVCVEPNVAYPKVVAVGAGGVSSFKGFFVGPYCFPP